MSYFFVHLSTILLCLLVKILTCSDWLCQNFVPSVNRGFHSTGVKKMGGHAHGNDYEYYLHAKHMYNLDRMKHQKLKMSSFVFACFSIGVAVPVYAVMFQQKKTGSS
ncbi:hypothetical protein MKW94_014583 [Papaver nudicaule]|uniref:SLL1 protein n=1 Tax=Papaver nudicaule TaxID=74823 RepID=A0AA42ATD5_PAPNU|nr:hypothetical protein [Papaver nudicaule]